MSDGTVGSDKDELFSDCIQYLRENFNGRFEWHVKLFEIVIQCHTNGNSAQKSIAGLLNILEKYNLVEQQLK